MYSTRTTLHAVGPSALAGLVVMAMLVLFNICILNRNKKLNRKVMAVTDTRVKTITEIISGIKVSGGRVQLVAPSELSTRRKKTNKVGQCRGRCCELLALGMNS